MDQELQKFEHVINKDHILDLCAKAIRLHDDRLVHHGEHVALIAYYICNVLNLENIDRNILLLLSTFHDVGAYKTDEITRMVEFETFNVQEHSVYGYLFLKYFSPWAEESKAVLYHHTKYAELQKLNFAYADYASLIHIADRVDIAILNHLSKEQTIQAIQAEVFKPEFSAAMTQILQTSNLHEYLTNNYKSNTYEHIHNLLDVTYEQALSLLKMLVYFIDFKSEVTAVHSVNAATVATFLAQKSGMSDQVVYKIYIAALMHDLGKLAIPSEILEKPMQLTADEMAIMRTHVLHTEKLLEGVMPSELVRIAARHHEKLDGSGYPHGLTADDLTPSERILAVADVMSALISKRSYKNAFDLDRALNILREMSNKGYLDASFVALTCDNAEELWQTVQDKNKKVKQTYFQLSQEYANLIQTNAPML